MTGVTFQWVSWIGFVRYATAIDFDVTGRGAIVQLRCWIRWLKMVGMNLLSAMHSFGLWFQRLSETTNCDILNLPFHAWVQVKKVIGLQPFNLEPVTRFTLTPKPGKQSNFDRKKFPPRDGFFVGWLPNQEPVGRGPPLKNHPQIQ